MPAMLPSFLNIALTAGGLMGWPLDLPAGMSHKRSLPLLRDKSTEISRGAFCTLLNRQTDFF
jgi:hypothetical protein